MTLPVDHILPRVLALLETQTRVVLSAEPGAGKTTRVPVALLGVPWLVGKRVLMLEPRRLAAVRSAQFMARQRQERVGETIGYTIRGESVTGRSTRVEIVTEGILTRRLQSDPGLEDVGAILFDEFHERSIHADLGLALALDVQKHLRPDMRILVMSATLHGVAISALLYDAPIVESMGRIHPVETRYLTRRHEGALEPLVAATIRKALAADEGDILVFLPGQQEIRRVQTVLGDDELPAGVCVHTLYGDASPEQQAGAMKPARRGERKVILATSIAETSLTIEGVRVVIDAGLARSSRFDPRKGMAGLVTTLVSQASADQRRGRAGRTAPGVCYRLWTEEQHRSLPAYSTPEILTTDLAPLALELARWGNPQGEGLRFLDPPPVAHLAQAHQLLRQLEALDASGKLTEQGKAMASLPIHPRLAHMLIRGNTLGAGALACDIAALLEERDFFRNARDMDIDLESRLHALRQGGAVDEQARQRVVAQASRLRSMLNVKRNDDESCAGILLALAYPERIAKRRGDVYQLAGGQTARLPQQSLLSREEFLAVGEVDGITSPARIFLASPLKKNDIQEYFAEAIAARKEVRWDTATESVVARTVTTLGAIELGSGSIKASEEELRTAMVEGIRTMGLDALPWTKESTLLRERNEWLRRRGFVDTAWPDLSDTHLLATLEQWLGPFLGTITKKAQLGSLDLLAILKSLFTFAQLKELDRLAPTHLTVPTGSRIALRYNEGEQPVLAVRLQEMFGEEESPKIAGGKERVLIHLLSPAHRPLAVTGDLASFWRNAYPEVRKEMRGRYPKHHWPEDPLSASPTRRTKKHNGA